MSGESPETSAGCDRVIVREANPDDAALLAEIGERTFRDAFAKDNTPQDMAAYLASAFSPEIQARELAAPGSVFLIAEVGESVVGYARLLRGPAPAAVRGERPIEVVRLYAKTDERARAVEAIQGRSRCSRSSGCSCCGATSSIWRWASSSVSHSGRWSTRSSRTSS